MTLGDNEMMSFLATTRADKAIAFYRDTLGLRLEEDSPFAIVMKGANGSVRIQKVQTFTPHPFTALGWKVDDIAGTVKTLTAAGVVFERFAGMSQDDLGIWASPSGAKVCWFKDPDGNVLSLTQVP